MLEKTLGEESGAFPSPAIATMLQRVVAKMWTAPDVLRYLVWEFILRIAKNGAAILNSLDHISSPSGVAG
jgi:hypothetical protein